MDNRAEPLTGGFAFFCHVAERTGLSARVRSFAFHELAGRECRARELLPLPFRKERGYVDLENRLPSARTAFERGFRGVRGVSTPAPFLSRHLGDYLLVAQLSEDPLGTVFRALYAADERRFVRLRVLQSEELAPESMRLTVTEDRLREFAPALPHDAIVVRPELALVEDVPFMTWDETAGWTLDTMLARVRSFGIRIPAEYALLIVERIAAALEHAHQSSVHGRPLAHGLLWPGFVSISHDAVVRVGGFGIAEGILPFLGGRRMTAEIAPYVAPESRRDAKPSPQALVASTLNVANCPMITVRLTGLVAMPGGATTVRTATMLVMLPAKLVITTSKPPASAHWAFVRV